MRYIIAFISVLCGSFSNAQNFILDTSFGTAGWVEFETGSPLVAKSIVKSAIAGEDIYHLTNYSAVLHMKADGSDADSFYHYLPAIFSDIKHINNSLYLIGRNNDETGHNIVIAKVNTDGSLDSAFGDDGVIVIDFGQSEQCADMILASDGKLFCSGTKSSGSVTHLVAFKIDAVNGGLITENDSDGYLEYTSNLTASTGLSGGFICEYNDNFLLVGNDISANSAYMTLIAVDQNGIIQENFGSNGFKNIQMQETSSENKILSVKALNGRIYCNYSYSVGINLTHRKLFAYGLESDNIIFNTDNGNQRGILSFAVYDDAIFTTEKADDDMNYSDKFYVTKLGMNGQVDTNFSTNGTYTFDSFSYNPVTHWQDEARSVIRLDDGDLIIAGYTSRIKALSGVDEFTIEHPYIGAKAIRITENALGLGLHGKKRFTVSPNPFVDGLNFTVENPLQKIALFDISGRQVAISAFFINDRSGRIEIDPTLASGVYIFKIFTDTGSFTQKVVKTPVK